MDSKTGSRMEMFDRVVAGSVGLSFISAVASYAGFSLDVVESAVTRTRPEPLLNRELYVSYIEYVEGTRGRRFQSRDERARRKRASPWTR
jgi:hypothetical protein